MIGHAKTRRMLLALVSVATLTLGRHGWGAEATPPPVPAVPPAVAPTVIWGDSLGGALARASHELKPVLLVFSAPDCPWCVRLKSETLAEQEVLAALAGFICVSLDTIRDAKIAQEFQVSGVPVSIILSGDGRVQAVAEGYRKPAAFLEFLNDGRTGRAGRSATAPELAKWEQWLQEGQVPATEWPLLMTALSRKDCRSRLHDAMLASKPCPQQTWVGLLSHPKLAVRLGAFELLEELAGAGFDYDPWLDAAANRPALARWQDWAQGTTNAAQSVFAALTAEQIAGYIRELASGDRERSTRAVRMLEQAGSATIPVLEEWLAASQPGIDEDARRRVQEVRYFLLLPETAGTERARLAHRLVFGNQDERLRSLTAAAAAGERALPVLADFLKDHDPLVREGAVDCILPAGKNKAFPYLCDLLKQEKDEEVVHAVVRGAGALKGPKAVELVGRYLTHANEDLVVAALASLGRTKSVAAAQAVKECLRSPRWRVRAAALEAIGTLQAAMVEDEVAACLQDADPFVRRTAVATLSVLAGKKAAARLAELFVQDDQLKGPIVAALRKMDKPIPPTFAPALVGKDPDVLLAVLEGLGDAGGGEAVRLAMPYLTHANKDVACAAIRLVARAGGGKAEVEAALVQVLQAGDKECVLALFESYQTAEDRRSNHWEQQEDFDQLVAPPADGTASAAADAGNALTDLFAAFATAPAAPATPAPTKSVTGGTATPPAATSPAADAVNLQDLFGAFGGANPPATAPALSTEAATATTDRTRPPVGVERPGRKSEALTQAAQLYLAAKYDDSLRFGAAQMLMAMGKGTGVAFMVETLASRTADERLVIAQRAGTCVGVVALPLLKRLLRDSSADVRQAAVAACLRNTADQALLQEVIAVVLEPGTPMSPADLFKESYAWYGVVRSAAKRHLIGASVRELLARRLPQRPQDAQRILALTLLDACWKEGDQPLVEGCLADENPFVRRAAWYTWGKHQPEAFAEKLATVASDHSEWVRGVIPAVYLPNDTLPWTIYFDATTATEGLSRFSASRTLKRLSPAVVTTLTALTRESVLSLRTAAAFCLFANREKVDVRVLTALVASAPDKKMVAYRLSSLLQDAPVRWLRELDAGDLLALLDQVASQTENEEDGRLAGLRKQLLASAVAAVEKPKIVPRQPEAGRSRTNLVAAVAGLTPTATGAEGAARLVVVFRNPGCPDCARVADWLRTLRTEFTDLVIEERNIRQPEDALLNEALCDRFEVPEKARLTAPAIFCGAGYRIKAEITFAELGRLLSRPEATETAWRQVNVTRLQQAETALGERYMAMGPWVVAGAGLLDGVNPCAFATIIFLLSYLQVTRRAPRQILAVGAAFVAGVFLAYFLLGLGLVEVVMRFSLLRRLGGILNVGMALFVAGVALLSIWDGVQCLRGRMGEMVLQLPGVLKARIHAAVRQSSRQRHFVAAAFVAGVVIAVLELACTGQVYAPTLLYMLKTGQGRSGAIGYLALYNLAFIVPLLVVFVGAYGGLRSERLTLWFQQRAALVKFATALLFAALFVLLLWGRG
jgi:HEAT repeat protein/cytochrome c biogenesis protein CcdA/glutaredoxin